MAYDYENGKTRIKNILNSNLEVIEKTFVPADSEFTFDNAYKVWISSIFVDIRNSTELFSNENKHIVAKIIKSFTSEVIEILREDNFCEEIGIRGDCVYAVYSTPKIDQVYNIADKTFWINTFMKMLNKLLESKNYPVISVGIGISTSQEMVIKAGRKGVGINSKVWIGDAVTKASKLSSLGNKNGYSSIVLSNCTYINIIKELEESNSNAKTWFTEKYDCNLGTHYYANIIKTEFDKWITKEV